MSDPDWGQTGDSDSDSDTETEAHGRKEGNVGNFLLEPRGVQVTTLSDSHHTKPSQEAPDYGSRKLDTLSFSMRMFKCKNRR